MKKWTGIFVTASFLILAAVRSVKCSITSPPRHLCSLAPTIMPVDILESMFRWERPPCTNMGLVVPLVHYLDALSNLRGYEFQIGNVEIMQGYMVFVKHTLPDGAKRCVALWELKCWHLMTLLSMETFETSYCRFKHTTRICAL